MRFALHILVITQLVVLSLTALAVDGVLEINGACAVNTGCFNGDLAGYPVTISASGSYRLTEKLDIQSLPQPANITVISIETSDVDLDLNGFAIVGVTTCTGIPVSCTNTGTGTGVLTSVVSNVRVHNGTIRGMGQNGVRLQGPSFGQGQGFSVESVRAVSNGLRGISIVSTHSSSVVDSVAQFNGGFSGIDLQFGGLIRGNAVQANATTGIRAGANSVVTGNIVSNNGTVGIKSNDSLVAENAIGNNPTGVDDSGGTNGSLIRDNVVRAATTGLLLSSEDGYSGNVLDNATDVTGGVQIGQNICSGALCP